MRPPSRRGWPAAVGLALVLGSPVGPAEAADTEAAETEAEARALLEAGKPRAAMIKLKNRLQEDPDRAAARFLLGRTYVQLGKLDAAAMAFERAKRAGAPRTDWQPILARVRLRQGQPQAAWDVARAQDGDAPAHRAELLVIRGQARLQQERPEDAEALFRQALELVPDQVNALRGKAVLAMRQGKLETAKAALDRARAAHPEEPGLWLVTAQLRQRRDDPAGVKAAYAKAHELAPDNRQAILGLAQAQLRLGEVDAAAELLDGLPEDRRSPAGRYLEAVVAVDRGDLDGARALLEPLVGRHDYPPARFLLGWVAFQQGRLETAAEALRGAVDDAPNRLAAAKLLAATYLRLDSPDRAVSVLDPLRDTAGDDPRFLVLAGRARIAAGDFTGGMADLRAAAEAAPEDAAIQSQVAMGFLAGGDREQAIPQLEKSVALAPDNRGGRLLLAVTHLEAGNYAQAVEVAKALEADLPDNPVPPNLLGLAHQGQGEPEAARDQFEKALERRSSFHPARLNLARLALAEGRTEAAGRHIEAVLEAKPEHVSALLLRADLASARGDGGERGRWLERAWEAHPDSRSAGLRLVRHRLATGEALKALDTARALERRHGDHPGVVIALAEAQLRTGHTASAVSNLRDLVTAHPEAVTPRLLLARGLRQQQSLDGAREQLHRTLELRPDHLEAMAALVDLELAAGRPQAAAEVAQRAREAAPASPTGDLLAGRVAYRAGRLEPAAEAFRQVLARGPNRLATRRLVTIRLKQERPEEALSLLRDWLAAHPEDHGMRLRLASLLQDRGELAEAGAAYEAVREAGRGSAGVWNNLAWIYHQQGDERALRYARKAHELAPENPAITDTYGWILLQGGQHQKALRLLQEAAIHAPHRPAIRYHLGVALWKNGRIGAARKELEQVLADDGGFAKAEEAREALEAMGTGSDA